MNFLVILPKIICTFKTIKSGISIIGKFKIVNKSSRAGEEHEKYSLMAV